MRLKKIRIGQDLTVQAAGKYENKPAKVVDIDKKDKAKATITVLITMNKKTGRTETVILRPGDLRENGD